MFLSESRRNHARPLTLWTWSKVVRRVALTADVPRFSTHTTRHLCLTDLARMGWEIHAIARIEDLVEFARGFSRRRFGQERAQAVPS